MAKKIIKTVEKHEDDYIHIPKWLGMIFIVPFAIIISFVMYLGLILVDFILRILMLIIVFIGGWSFSGKAQRDWVKIFVKFDVKTANEEMYVSEMFFEDKKK